MLNSGFGYFRNDKGILIKKESNYSKKIGDDVDIGINTVIDNGSYRDTIIGNGTKIDNLVHIGHNAVIGEHCLIVAGTVIGGSVQVGSFTYIGMNVSVKDHVKIGIHCIIGAGSVVIKDVDDYSIIAGNPAKQIKTNLSAKQLHDMAHV